MPASHCSDDSLDLNDLFNACTPQGYPDDRKSNPIQMCFNAFCLKADDLYVHLQENMATEAEEALQQRNSINSSLLVALVPMIMICIMLL